MTTHDVSGADPAVTDPIVTDGIVTDGIMTDGIVTDGIEAAVGESWAEVLDIAPGTPGTFLSLGGHSIAANRLRTRLARLGLTVTLTDLFDDPSLDDLLHTLRARADAATDDPDEGSR
ncbi:phosphopantetheine-binding protein [Myceligenerans indicum]|uniref:Acyl carrier protein n=1 Tax=Myceligenerans indicum TaxID=2593663 RepID=A0ABS1LHJ0_9MICO|nr:phosphopantetheine-binding protein [Myceligenerans indicum]MBL0885619.1 acyl carrier protein [Myceligenerans indicum]